MRFAHARPATVTLVAGSVLITATSGFSLAAVMGATSAWAHPSGYAAAMDDAAVADQSCQPLKSAGPTSSPTGSPTSSPTGSPTSSPTDTKTAPSTTPS